MSRPSRRAFERSSSRAESNAAAGGSSAPISCTDPARDSPARSETGRIRRTRRTGAPHLSWANGIHRTGRTAPGRLKPPFPQGSVGSNPTSGTASEQISAGGLRIPASGVRFTLHDSCTERFQLADFGRWLGCRRGPLGGLRVGQSARGSVASVRRSQPNHRVLSGAVRWPAQIDGTASAVTRWSSAGRSTRSTGMMSVVIPTAAAPVSGPGLSPTMRQR